MLRQLCPVHTMHISTVEASRLLTYHLLVHRLTLLNAVYGARARDRDRLQCIGLGVELLGTASEDEERLPLLVLVKEGRA